jgi:hypothetical protein
MKKVGLILMMFCLVSSCKNIAWIGYKKPLEKDFESLGASSNCMRIGVQNLDSLQRKAVLSAAAAVCKIFSDTAFKTRVVAQSWLLSCDERDGNVQSVPGYEVLKIIDQKVSDFSVNPHKPWLAIAQTQRGGNNININRIAIDPARISAWYSNDRKVKAQLVNTVAHEIMHLVSNDFRDRGHGSADCPDNRLVSYGIGNLAAEIWLQGND